MNINFDNYKEYEILPSKSLKISICNTLKQIQEITHLCKVYVDIIAWSYDDLKFFDKLVIQHTIDLIEGAKLVRQKQRLVNPKIEMAMKQEVLKLYKAEIIYPIKYSTWVSNLVPIKKKNGEIQLYVDFQRLNRVSLKDNYPLPLME